MKKIAIIIFSLSISTQCLTAQTSFDKDKLIEKFISCFSTKSTASIESMLDDSFSMMGQKMPLSLKIFQAIILQLNDTVDSTKYNNTVAEDDVTVISYDVFFSSKKRTVDFHITPSEKIKKIAIEGIGVQTKKLTEMGTAQVENLPNVIQVPFRLHSNLPIVAVKVNGEDQNFFFDSGAPTIILNAKYYNNATNTHTVMDAKGVSGQEIQANIQNISAFEFAGIKAENMDVMCSDLSQLENSDDEEVIPIHGLIGYSYIKDFDIMYDYAKQTITLIKKDYAPQLIDALKANNMIENSVAMQQVRHIPYVSVTIGSKEYTMGIDCGASSNLLDSNKSEEVKSNLTNLETVTLRGGDTKGIERKSGDIDEMKIGNSTFTDIPTVFSNIDHLNILSDVKLHGLIGYPILSKQKCIVSYHSNSLIFLK